MKLQKLKLGSTYGFRTHNEHNRWDPIFPRMPASLNWTELNSNKTSKKQRRTK